MTQILDKAGCAYIPQDGGGLPPLLLTLYHTTMLKNDWSKPMEVKYWNSRNFFITFSDWNSNPVDLTWATILFTVKKTNEIEQTTDTDNTALLQKVITDTIPLEWKITVAITPDDTVTIGIWDFVYDIKIIWNETKQWNSPLSTISILKVATQITDTGVIPN